MAAVFSINDWLDELYTRVSGASTSELRQEIRATLREFTVQSGAFQVELAPIDIVANQEDYDLEPLQAPYDNFIVLYIVAIAYDADPGADNGFARFLKPLQSPNHRYFTSVPGDQPFSYITYLDEPGRFTLKPFLSVDGPEQLRPTVALGFPEGANFQDDQIPIQFRRYWYDHIVDGVCGRMMAMQDKPYSNLVQARYHMQRFRTGMSQARDMGRNQMNTSENEFIFPSWA